MIGSRRISDLGIRQKLFISYFMLVLFFLCLYLVINTVLVVNENKKQVLRSAEHVFGQTRAYLQYKTESVRNLLYFLTSNSVVQELFERRATYYHENIGRWPIDSQTFEKMSYLTTFNPDIVAIKFYMAYGLASVFQNETFISLAQVQNAAWYRRLLRNERRIYWYADPAAPEGGAKSAEYGSARSGNTPYGGARLIHAARSVLNSQNIKELTGVVQFDISRAMLRATLGNAILTESSFALLINADGEVVDSTGTVPAGNAASFWSKLSALRGGDFGTESWDTVSLARSTYLVGTQVIEGTDWVLMLVLPNRDIVRLSARPAQKMLLVFASMTPLTLFLAFFVSRSATKRIKGLIMRMDRVVQGDFSVTLDPGNRDEIGQLTERFNFMIAEVEQLMEEKYSLGKEVKNLELKALQAQINPHFLYNTLDLINWMSVRHNAEEIRTLVTALSRFYKLSLGKGEDTVPLREELEHARTYVQIQNMRYEDAIELVIDTPADMNECRVLKLVLQPLVENSIFHGIMMKKEERGVIRITGQRVDGDLLLFVEDDGVGMSDERLGQILANGAVSSDRHGYGVRNIHERLQLTYGPEFGLSFQSTEGKGTRVRIRIPAVQA
ncbi:MAG: sensor histidine kinase [Spirochaetia bacterium]|jgi:two-component system sensor histidine kinase YesM